MAKTNLNQLQNAITLCTLRAASHIVSERGLASSEGGGHQRAGWQPDPDATALVSARQSTPANRDRRK